MDTELLKTFLEVSRTRHFGQAANNLYITQSAVSARIKLLEETLKIQLFNRDRNNIQLTPAGTRLLKHAGLILTAWNRTVQDMALEEENQVLVSISGMYSVWDSYLQDRVNLLRPKRPDLALRLDAGDQASITRRLLEGSLDMGFVYDAPQIPELVTQEAAVMQLILVSTESGLDACSAMERKDYILVDWGESFAVQDARLFPSIPAPALHMGMGRMALSFMLANGGSAYLAQSMVSTQLKKQRLFPVNDAPAVERIIHLAYATANPRQDVLTQVFKDM